MTPETILKRFIFLFDQTKLINSCLLDARFLNDIFELNFYYVYFETISICSLFTKYSAE